MLIQNTQECEINLSAKDFPMVAVPPARKVKDDHGDIVNQNGTVEVDDAFYNAVITNTVVQHYFKSGMLITEDVPVETKAAKTTASTETSEYAAFKKDELLSELTERGIEAPAGATKADIIALLEANDADNAEA